MCKPLLLERYKKLCEQLYLEPKEEQILGSFFVPITQPPAPLRKKNDNRKAQKKKRPQQESQVTSLDIRQYFNQPDIVQKQSTTEDSVYNCY